MYCPLNTNTLFPQNTNHTHKGGIEIKNRLNIEVPQTLGDLSGQQAL